MVSMNSEEMNARINEIDEHGCSDNEIYHSCIGDKVIPYIGWFWRTVNFDNDHCWLDVLPVFEYKDGLSECNNSPKVGFMQNNKWDYEAFKIEGEQWKTLRKLIVDALTNMNSRSFRTVDLYMQSLI